MKLSKAEAERYRRDPKKLLGTWWEARWFIECDADGNERMLHLFSEVVRASRRTVVLRAFGVGRYPFTPVYGERRVRLTVLLDPYGTWAHHGHKIRVRRQFAVGTVWSWNGRVFRITEHRPTGVLARWHEPSAVRQFHWSWSELLSESGLIMLPPGHPMRGRRRPRRPKRAEASAPEPMPEKPVRDTLWDVLTRDAV